MDAANETSAPAAGTTPTTPAQSPADRIRAARAATRAQFVSGALDEAPAAEAKSDAKPDKMPAGVPEPSDEGDSEPAAGAETPSPRPAPAAKPDDDKPDPETAKRLAKVQEADRRAREKLAAERAEFEKERKAAAAERAELEKAKADLEAFRKAQERAKVDPLGYLRAAGVTDPADLEYAARAAYAVAKGEPATKEAAAKALRDREADDRVATLEKRLADFEKQAKEREESATIQRQVTQYVEGLKKAAASGEHSPLAKHFLAKDPEATEADLRQVTYELAQELGDAPDHEDVLARYEQRQRALLARFGVDPSTLLNATPPKTNSQPAAKKPAAPTLGNDLSTPSVPRPRASERASRAETRRMLEEGRLE